MMKRYPLLKMLLATLIVIMTGMAIPAGAQVMISADEFFEYDKVLPLEPDKKFLFSNPLYDRYWIEYSSVNAERVPGWLTIPRKGKKPFPCVIVGHGGGGSKQDFDMLYGYLASRGFASLAIDSQYHGEREVEGKQLFSSRWYEMRTIIIQTVIDLRRSIDFIETVEEVDSNRIGYLGLSMGVLIGTPFIAIDERVKTAVLVVGGGDYNAIMNDSQILPFVLLKHTSGIPVHEIADKFAPVDPVNYIGRFAPRPLLMLNGKYDNVLPTSAAKALYEAAKEPKEIVWFESGHIPPFDKVMYLTTKWLNKYLKKIKPVKKKVASPEKTVEYVEGEVSVEASISAEMVGEERIVTLEARPQPEDAVGLVVEAVFPEINFRFELYDDGHRGDEVALDGIFSIKLPLEEILKGIIPDSIYECYINVRTPGGEILAETYAGNAMQRSE